MLISPEGLNLDSEVEKNNFFSSYIFLPAVGFEHLLLCTVLEIDSQDQNTTFHEWKSEGEPVITHLTASLFHAG